MKREDWERARLDPADVFGSPEAIRDDPDLTREQKIDLLCRWAYDDREVLVAEEEGMVRGEPPAAARVLRILDELTGGFDTEHTPPTKQGGVVLENERAAATDSRASKR
jgi:hypothetical protein